MKNLKKALDEIFGEHSCEEKDLIIEAVKKDNSSSMKPTDEMAEILNMFNDTFGKRSRIMPAKIMNRYKQLLKTYNLSDIQRAFTNAKNDDYHRDTGYKHLTLEFFSRADKLDKWESFNPKEEKKSNFVMPKMNTGN